MKVYNMVRFAVEKDLERINELRRQVNELHVKGRSDIFKAGFGEELQEAARVWIWGENSDILVVEREGVLCGVACVDYVHKPETPYGAARCFYHVQELVVDEAFRRQGVAGELFAFMKEEAAKRGFDKIELDVWEFNASAIEFYRAMGFRETRRWMEYSL